MIGYYIDDDYNNLYKTIDGGVTFNMVNGGLDYYPSDIEFVD